MKRIALTRDQAGHLQVSVESDRPRPWRELLADAEAALERAHAPIDARVGASVRAKLRVATTRAARDRKLETTKRNARIAAAARDYWARHEGRRGCSDSQTARDLAPRFHLSIERLRKLLPK
jgi:hypothetical protein